MIPLTFHRFRRPRVYTSMLCLHCKRETSNAKFCTRTCAVIVNNSLKPKRKRKTQELCVICQIRTHRSRSKRCSICINALHHANQTSMNKQTLADVAKRYSQIGISPSYRHAYVRYHCHRLNRHLQKRCQICGYDTHVELCHIKAISSFDLSATLDEVNASTNIAVLCRNHHWELDNGIIRIQDIPPR